MRERRSSAETQSLSQPVGIQLRMSDRVSVWSCCLDEEINIVTMKENLSDRQTRSPMLECFCCNCADCSFFFFFSDTSWWHCSLPLHAFCLSRFLSSCLSSMRILRDQWLLRTAASAFPVIGCWNSRCCWMSSKALMEDSFYRWEKSRRHTSNRGSPTVENKIMHMTALIACKYCT